MKIFVEFEGPYFQAPKFEVDDAEDCWDFDEIKWRVRKRFGIPASEQVVRVDGEKVFESVGERTLLRDYGVQDGCIICVQVTKKGSSAAAAAAAAAVASGADTVSLADAHASTVAGGGRTFGKQAAREKGVGSPSGAGKLVECPLCFELREDVKALIHKGKVGGDISGHKACGPCRRDMEKRKSTCPWCRGQMVWQTVFSFLTGLKGKVQTASGHNELADLMAQWQLFEITSTRKQM